MFSWIARIPQKYPFGFGVAYSGFKGGAVDAIIQTQVEGVPITELDMRRNGLFTLFNASFAGAWQYFLFVKIMGRIYPGAGRFAAKTLSEKIKDTAGMRNLVAQNFIENGINNPFLYFPTFYGFKALMEREEAPLRVAWRNYTSNFHEDIPAILSVWVPAQFLNFGFSPMWFRVPFVATVSAFWTGYVSLTRGAADSSAEDVDKVRDDVICVIERSVGAPAGGGMELDGST